MSHAVMRGAPTAAQRYLDVVTAELAAETGRPEDRYSLARILYKCLRDHPHDIRQIYGESGERDTNEALLRRSVSAALALQAAGLASGDTALVISRNTPELSALYFGAIFCGVVLLPLHVGITASEVKHFISLSEPSLVFADAEDITSIERALDEIGLETEIIQLRGATSKEGRRNFEKFISGHDDLIRDFRPAPNEPDSPVLMLTTSGSTGLPKAVVLTHRGLVAQLPTLWTHHETFPRPSALYLCVATSQWATYTMAITGCAAYRVSVLTTSEDSTAERVRSLVATYKPTIALMPPYLAGILATLRKLEPRDLASIDEIFLAGSAVPEKTKSDLQMVLRSDARVRIMYGLTEMQGAVTMTSPDASVNAVGSVINTILFKIIDEEGNTLGCNQPGELCLKSNDCIFKGYLNNDEATKNTFTEDGWLRSGDQVYVNESGEIIFVDRLKFFIKYRNHQISPSEVENVITKLSEVEAVAVCGAELGPAALVVPRPGYKLTPQDVHRAVNSTLSNFKQLRGGIALVPSIPLLANGKINRNEVKSIFQNIGERKKFYGS